MKIGLIKPIVAGTGSFTIATPKPLDNTCLVKEYVSHGDIKGVIKEINGNTYKINTSIGEVIVVLD